VPLDRRTVERHAGRHIHELQQARHVGDAEKRRIREMHERLAQKAEQSRRGGK